jgi:hypothetical protein
MAGDPLPEGPDAGIVVAALESQSGPEPKSRLELLESRANILLILPKYLTHHSLSGGGWADLAEPLDDGVAIDILCLIVNCERANPKFIRRDRTETADPTRNLISVRPSFQRDLMRLIKMDGLFPIVYYPEGILLGEMETKTGGRLWILSDPDPVSNHGILIKDNLKFALSLVDLWMENHPNAPVIFDETHIRILAMESEGSFDFSRFFKYPYVLIMLLSILAALLFALFGLKRYWPEREAKEEPVYGKERLIANSARLLARGGFEREIFLRHLSLTLNSMGRILHAPRRAFVSEWDLINFLDSGRTWETPLGPLYAEALREARGGAPLAKLLFYAQLFHKRKKEIEIGPGTRRKNT